MKEWSDSFLACSNSNKESSSISQNCLNSLCTIALINARSIKTIFDIILAYISEYNPTIVAFTETWLSSNDIYAITMLIISLMPLLYL